MEIDVEDEKRRQRVENILEKNTQTFNNCIVCNEPILAKDLEVETIHGFYHGYPYECLNGRQGLF